MIRTVLPAGSENRALEELLPLVEHSGFAPRIRVAIATLETKGCLMVPITVLASRVDQIKPSAVPACVFREEVCDQSFSLTSIATLSAVETSVTNMLSPSAVQERILIVALATGMTDRTS